MSDDRKKTPGNRGRSGSGPGARDPGGGKPKFGKPAAKKGDRPTTYRTERTPRPADASAEKLANVISAQLRVAERLEEL